MTYEILRIENFRPDLVSPEELQSRYHVNQLSNRLNIAFNVFHSPKNRHLKKKVLNRSRNGRDMTFYGFSPDG